MTSKKVWPHTITFWICQPRKSFQCESFQKRFKHHQLSSWLYERFFVVSSCTLWWWVSVSDPEDESPISLKSCRTSMSSSWRLWKRKKERKKTNSGTRDRKMKNMINWGRNSWTESPLENARALFYLAMQWNLVTQVRPVVRWLIPISLQHFCRVLLVRKTSSILEATSSWVVQSHPSWNRKWRKN